MQTYPELSTRERWQLLLWMARHPVALMEDTLPAGARLLRRRRPLSARRRLTRTVALASVVVPLALALARRLRRR